jgi:histidinol-phosphatase (PHP family)
LSHVSSRLVDYHVHSKYSIDGRSSIDDLCRRAVRLGLVEIGFSEHVEFEPEDSGFGFFDYQRYSEALDQARSRYNEGLRIRKGVEVDYNHEYEGKIREFLIGKDFDFVTAGVHYIDHIAFDLNKNLKMTPEKAVQKYYTKIRQAIDSGLFNVIAHFDLIRDYIPLRPDTVSPTIEIIDAVLDEMVAKRVYLEINSRRTADRDPYPSRSLIQRYLAKGGQLFSFGSDAHSTLQLGVGIMEAMNLLNDMEPRNIRILFE